MYTYITSTSEASSRTDHERREPADERDPGGPGRRRAVEAVAELAGVRVLEDEAGGERKRDREDPEHSGEHRRAAGHGVRDRHEAEETASLRDRDRVGEAWEDERDERQREDRERAAEHPGRPPTARREERKRHADQAGDGDGAAAREQPLGDVVAVEIAGELAWVLRERPPDLLPGRVVDRGRLDHRPQPGERDRGRDGQRRKAGQRRCDLAANEQRPRKRE